MVCPIFANDKILIPIVVLALVDVMHFCCFRKPSPYSFLCNKDMLKNVSIYICTRMVMAHPAYIPHDCSCPAPPLLV